MKVAQRCLLVLLIIGGALPALASSRPTASAKRVEKIFNLMPGLKGITMAEFQMYSPREYEKATGKKLRFKEKIVYKVIRWKVMKAMRRGPTEQQKTLGWLSVVFGAMAIGLLLIPTWIGWIGLLCAVAGFVLGIKSLKGNSNAPGLIGLIVSSTVILVTIIAVIALLSMTPFY